MSVLTSSFLMARDSPSGTKMAVAAGVSVGIDAGSVKTERTGCVCVLGGACSIRDTSSRRWSFLLYSAISLAFFVFFGIGF